MNTIKFTGFGSCPGDRNYLMNHVFSKLGYVDITDKTTNKCNLLVYTLYNDIDLKNYIADDMVCIFFENFSRFNLSETNNPYCILSSGHYMISTERINHPRHLRFTCAPIYLSKFERKLDLSTWEHTPVNIHTKQNKVAFMSSNSKSKYRQQFVEKLSKYIPVDCLGSVMNNTFKLPKNTIQTVNTLSKYKFILCFENTSHYGYNTEKIWWAYLAKSVPLYWGDPGMHLDYCKSSFVSRHDYCSDELYIEHIVNMQHDDQTCINIIDSQKLVDKSYIQMDNITKFINNIKKTRGVHTPRADC